MNISHIENFLHLAKTLNFSESAKALYISQPTLSKQINSLEQELDVKLFNRNNKDVQLTDVGKQLIPYFTQIMIEMSNVKVLTGKLKQQSAGFSIALEKYLDINRIIPGFLLSIKNKYKDTNFTINNYNSKELIEKIENRKVDCGLTFSTIMYDKTNMNIVPIIRNDIYIYYSKHLINKDTDKIQLKDFNNLPAVQIKEEGNETVEFGETIDNHLNLRAKNVIIVPDIYTMQVYVEAGLGYCVMGQNSIIGSSNVCKYNLTKKHDIPKAGVDLIYLKSNNNPLLQEFLKTYKEISKKQ